MAERKIDDFIDLLLYERGVLVEREGITMKALVKDATESLQYYNDKYIRCKFIIHTGDLIRLIEQNKNYLIISEISQFNNHFKARLRLCNHQLVIEIPGQQVLVGYDYRGAPIYEMSDPTFEYYYSIVENKVMDIETNQPIVLLENEIIALLQDSEVTREKFIEGSEFTFQGKTYTVIGVDRTKYGLLSIKASLSV
ncbi:hypothetical protein [Schinkia azotoformans]|uniref:hypothetical protein n=1 Tax=Schinkia azotoformans TaxID=1454 RepID=UPI002DBDB020|nr:hypothetical protein [Schinkia azotoformans]MEC1788645.1 hypothetical protein [Schinkia azotoformans]MED4419964.1 hypothetical protein [Schinkia azotoformans]